ncbi:hypothetical protein PM082_008569 [Marasmius tenuissimus]|nr:hypothetical protein PM082_008569 [Marasmius tenuissimus]
MFEACRPATFLLALPFQPRDWPRTSPMPSRTLSATSMIMTAGLSQFEQVRSFSHKTSLTEVYAASRRMMRRARRLENRQDDAQISLTLDPKVILKVRDQRSGMRPATETYATSLESSNNFINFCATVNLPLTNGTQNEQGSCNPAPMGFIPSIDRIPSLKFQFPLNGAVLTELESFTVRLKVTNLIAGNFVNAQTNYLAAPQHDDLNGFILGYSAIIIEELGSLEQTTPTNPNIFDFTSGAIVQVASGFHALNITSGLLEGVYRLSSVTKDANHHPIVVPLLQHGAIDDAVYFTVIANSTTPRARTMKRRKADVNSVFPREDENRSTSNSTTSSAAQNSTTLLFSQVATGFATDGQETDDQAKPGEPLNVASLTSRNNFINYCLTLSRGLTNGQQSGSDSCNPIPIGVIPSKDNMPSFKFVSPRNFATLTPHKGFTIRLNFTNIDIEVTDPEIRYMSAPQQLSSNGLVKGYARVVIEALTSFNQTSFTDPRKFAFAASMNVLDDTRMLLADAPNCLPAGFYRLSSRALTANHAPIGLPVYPRGAVDDVVYFQVGDGGSGSTAANSLFATAPASTSTFTSTAPSGSPGSGDSGSNQGSTPIVLGAAIGGSIGGLILVVLIAILIVLLRRHRTRKDSEPTFDLPQSPQMADIHPFLETHKGAGERAKDRQAVVSLEIPEPSETAESSSRRFSAASAAPSYHTVAPVRS